MKEFVLRPLKLSDAVSFSEHANNKKVAKNMRDVFPFPYTVENGKAFIRRLKKEKRQLTLAIEIDGKAVGCVGATFMGDVYSKSAELGYWLGEEFWGQGVMTEVVRQMCKKIFAEYDVVRISAEVFSYNKASKKVLEKNGFALEGVLRKSVYKHGSLHDSCAYALIKE